MSHLDYQPYHKRHLPHFQPPGAAFFITFRLSGSLALPVIQRLSAEAVQLEHKIEKETDPSLQTESAYKLQKMLFARWDSELDASRHPDWLSNPQISQIVVDTLHDLDGVLYDLETYCVMPNHVHMVCIPKDSEKGSVSLAHIMHLLKGRTARQANLLLDRTGPFWQHESYDHVVRDVHELERIIKYILNNPVKAGLTDARVYYKHLLT